jgi:DNA-binding winged helix-turn-helix (wHTH) protein
MKTSPHINHISSPFLLNNNLIVNEAENTIAFANDPQSMVKLEPRLIRVLILLAKNP